MPTKDVGEREEGADTGKGREEEKEGARVGDPARDVGETGVKTSKGTGKEETRPEGAGDTAGQSTTDVGD